jgi:polyisoprenoid-binding protein YceI
VRALEAGGRRLLRLRQRCVPGAAVAGDGGCRHSLAHQPTGASAGQRRRGATQPCTNTKNTATGARSAASREGLTMSWHLDSVHSHVGFSVKHMMVTTVRGQFKGYTGSLQLDPKDFSRSTFQGEIDVASVDTGNADRDNHLRTGDFFDAPNHPKITFKSTSIEPKGEGAYVVHGDLGIRGVTKNVALEVEFHGVSKNPYGKTVAGLSATGTINRKDFGVAFNAVLETGGVAVGEKVKLELDVEATWAE